MYEKIEFPKTRIKMKSQKEAKLLMPLLTNFLYIRNNYHNMFIIGKWHTQKQCANKDWDSTMISCDVHPFFSNVGLVMAQVFKILKKKTYKAIAHKNYNSNFQKFTKILYFV